MDRRAFGGEYKVFRGPLYQQGYGFGGYFKKFFKWIVPIAEKHLLPKLKYGAEELGKQGIESLSNIASDILKGKNIKKAAEENLNLAIDKIKDKVESNLKGSGIKRKAKKVFFQKLKKNKKSKKDIFKDD